MRRLLILPICVLGLAILNSAQGDDKDPTADDELRVKNAFQSTDGPSLVMFLSTRAKGEVSQEKLVTLIAALDSRDASARQKACAELVAVGAPAIPMLRQAAREVDTPEAAALARRCLTIIEEDPGLVSTAIIRLLGARKPEGAAKALLAFLPHAENDSVMDELRSALSAVAYDKGKADPSVISALTDEHPLRRASAVTAICSNGTAEPRATLRKLLLDPMPSVRLRASLALAQVFDAKAVSTLITLLADLPEMQSKEVEAYLQELAGDQAPKVAVGPDELSRQKARDAWAKWWLDSETPTLLDEVRKRTLTEIDTTQIQAMIEKLGDESFEVRQRSEDELKKLGGRIVPLLRQAQRHSDLEVRNRATKCLAAIEGEKTPPLSPVTARLIALRKPKGAVEALLGYVPYADDEIVADELQNALNATAYPDGKAHPAIVKALDDKVPVRRAAAAQALCSGPVTDHLPRLRAMLKDKDATVRLRVALALAGAREPEAVPPLIALVRELPPESSALAEEYLLRLARENPPKDLPDGDDNAKKRADLWDKWWAANKASVVMIDRYAPTRERDMGYTMLVQMNNNQIIEWDKEKKQRWQITGLNNPIDAQYLPSGRILITEQGSQRVTERNPKGDIIWTASVPSWPIQAERLSNGHTFIVCTNMLLTVDRAGKQVSKIDRPQNDVLTARRMQNGQIVVVTRMRQVQRLDRSGKMVKSFPITNVYSYQNEILKNGHVLVTVMWNNQVIEYNAEGKEVMQANVNQPIHALRLANGNTLVSSQNWPPRIYELDKKGNQIGDYATNNAYVYRMRRR